MERNTRQRSAIRDAIALADRPLLPQEVLEAAQHEVPGLGIATVYRNLKVLVEEGDLADLGPLKTLLRRMAPQGFTLEDHDLTLYGRCKDCVAPADKCAKSEACDVGSHKHTTAHTRRPRN